MGIVRETRERERGREREIMIKENIYRGGQKSGNTWISGTARLIELNLSHIDKHIKVISWPKFQINTFTWAGIIKILICIGLTEKNFFSKICTGDLSFCDAVE